jgi:hypothetical protein
MGIISAAGTSMSMLTNKGPFKWHPAHQEIKDVCAQAAQICKVCFRHFTPRTLKYTTYPSKIYHISKDSFDKSAQFLHSALKRNSKTLFLFSIYGAFK